MALQAVQENQTRNLTNSNYRLPEGSYEVLLMGHYAAKQGRKLWASNKTDVRTIVDHQQIEWVIYYVNIDTAIRLQMRGLLTHDPIDGAFMLTDAGREALCRMEREG